MLMLSNPIRAIMKRMVFINASNSCILADTRGPNWWMRSNIRAGLTVGEIIKEGVALRKYSFSISSVRKQARGFTFLTMKRPNLDRDLAHLPFGPWSGQIAVFLSQFIC